MEKNNKIRNGLLAILLVVLLIPITTQLKAQEPIIGAQVFIEPGQNKQDVETWFKLLADHNMPVCRIRVFEDHMNLGNGKWDFSRYDHAFDMAQKYEVKIMVTLFPSDRSVGGFKFPKNLEHQKSVEEYVRETVRHFKDHPALDTWVLQNEPGAYSYSKDAYSLPKYEKWKSQQEKPEYKNDYMKSYPEFELFWRDYTTDYLGWLAKIVREEDPKGLTHVNNHMLFSNLPQYDFPQWMPFLSTLGASIHAAWHLGYFERQQYTMAIAANCDIIRSAAEPKPFWVTELQGGTNIFSGFNPLCPSEDDIAQWLWTCIGSGAERVVFWTLNARASSAEAGEWGMITYQNGPTDRLTMSGNVTKVLLDEKDFFETAKTVKSNVNLIYSPESMIIFDGKIMSSRFDENVPGRRKGAHIKSILSYYETLLELGITSNVKQMDHFDWEAKTDKPRIAILANMLSIPTEFKDKLNTFVENGNKLIVTGLSGFYDENMHNVYMSSDPYRKLFGATLEEFKFVGDSFALDLTDPQVQLPAHLVKGIIKTDKAKVIGTLNDDVIAVRNQYGKGEVVWIPSLIGLGSWQKDNTSFAAFIKKETKEVAQQLPFKLSEHSKHIMLKTMEADGNYLTILVNMKDENKSIALEKKVNKKARLIFGGKLIENVDIRNIHLAPQETVVILWQ
jgi:beta-galactosidase